MTLRNRIHISILASILGILFLLGATLLLQSNRNFRQYLAIEQQIQTAELVQQIETVYQRSGASAGELEYLVSSERIYLEIYDQNGQLIDSYDGIPDNMVLRGNYVEREIPVLNALRQQVGTMKIGFWDHSLLSQSAERFSRALSGSILLTTLIAFVLSLFISYTISRHITRPVQQIMEQTEKIRDGDYSLRPEPRGFALEFDQLTDNINSLSDALQSQEQHRKKYAQDIGHELRTPVTALKLHIAAIQDGLRPANEENLKLLSYEVNRLSRLIEMLATSFEERGQTGAPQIESVRLKPMVEELTASLRPMFSADEVQLLTEISTDCVLESDRERLRQILYNLLSNAKKAVEHGGTVRLTAKCTKKQIVITVQDNGIGIRSADLPHIFDRFYRADTARNTKQGGTGLGLSIVKAHVQSLHGTIKVDSTPGEGSSFITTLPAQWPESKTE